MKIIGIVLSIILFLVPIIIGIFMFDSNEVIRSYAIVLIGGYVGQKSIDDARMFYKWFKSKLK